MTWTDWQELDLSTAWMSASAAYVNGGIQGSDATQTPGWAFPFDPVDAATNYEFQFDYEAYVPDTAWDPAPPAPYASIYSLNTEASFQARFDDSFYYWYGDGQTVPADGSAVTLTVSIGPGLQQWDTGIAAGETNLVFYGAVDLLRVVGMRYRSDGALLSSGGGGGGSTPTVLTGTGGTLTNVDLSAGAVKYQYAAPFDGSFIFQITAPTGWVGTLTMYDPNNQATPLFTTAGGSIGYVAGSGDVLVVGVTPQDGSVPVEITWSYAQRASSQLTVALRSDTITETPGALYATISGGVPNDIISFDVIGPTLAGNLQSARLNVEGYLPDLYVSLPALTRGDYLLRVESLTSGSEDVPFTVTGDPLSYGGSGATTPPPPTTVPVVRWQLYGLHDTTPAYTFVHNPKSWSNLLPPNTFTHDNTTAPDGQILTWQAGGQPWRMEFTGYLDTQQEYEDLTFWANLHRRFWLVDHRNRAWLVTFEQFDATARIVPNRPWAHDYTMKTIVFMQG